MLLITKSKQTGMYEFDGCMAKADAKYPPNVLLPAEEMFETHYYSYIDGALRRVSFEEFHIDVDERSKNVIYKALLYAAGLGSVTVNLADHNHHSLLLFYENEEKFRIGIPAQLLRIVHLSELFEFHFCGLMWTDLGNYVQACRFKWDEAVGEVRPVQLQLPLPIRMYMETPIYGPGQLEYIEQQLADTYPTVFECRDAAVSRAEVVKF